MTHSELAAGAARWGNPKGRCSPRGQEQKGAVTALSAERPGAGAVTGPWGEGHLQKLCSLVKGLCLVAPQRERRWGKECPDPSLPTSPSPVSTCRWPDSDGSWRTREPVVVVPAGRSPGRCGFVQTTPQQRAGWGRGGGGVEWRTGDATTGPRFWKAFLSLIKL